MITRNTLYVSVRVKGTAILCNASDEVLTVIVCDISGLGHLFANLTVWIRLSRLDDDDVHCKIRTCRCIFVMYYQGIFVFVQYCVKLMLR